MLELERKVSSASKVIKEALDGGRRASVAYLGGASSLVLLHLIKVTIGLDDVDVFYVQSRSMRPELFYFMDKLSRLWSFIPCVERLPEWISTDVYPGGGISAEVSNVLLRHNCPVCFTPVLGPFEGGASSSDKHGFVELRPMYLFSEEDVYRYINEYRTPLCSVDLHKITSNYPGAGRLEDEEEKKVRDRLRSLGYI